MKQDTRKHIPLLAVEICINFVSHHYIMGLSLFCHKTQLEIHNSTAVYNCELIRKLRAFRFCFNFIRLIN